MFDVLGTGSVPLPVVPGSRPDEAPRPPLGQLLLERGHLTEEQLQAGLAQHQWTGRPLGEVLIALGFVSETTIAQALATQHGGLIRTEYGFATGFDASLRAGPAVAPPVSHPYPDEPEATVIPLPVPVELSPVVVTPSVPAPALDVTTSLRIEELERELASANLELAAANARFPELESELRAHTLRVQTSDQLASVANARIAELEGEVESARVALSAAIPAADERAAATAAQIEALDDELQAAHASLEAAAGRFEALERELAATRQTAAELRDENERLTSDLSGVRQELEATRDELALRHGELASTVESFRAAYTRLQYLESAAAVPPQSAPAPQRQPSPDGRRAAFDWQS